MIAIATPLHSEKRDLELLVRVTDAVKYTELNLSVTITLVRNKPDRHFEEHRREIKLLWSETEISG